MINDSGALDPPGTHLGIYSEPGGHGLYNLKRHYPGDELPIPGISMMTFFPSQDREGSYFSDVQYQYKYSLHWQGDRLWPLYFSGDHQGNNKLY